MNAEIKTAINSPWKAAFIGTQEQKKILTQTEWKIFLLHLEGWSKKQIADYVFSSEETVRTHESNIRKKLGVHSMSNAMLKALSKKIVEVTALGLMILTSSLTLMMMDLDKTDAQPNPDTRRAPRVVRTNSGRRVFRDYLV